MIATSLFPHRALRAAVLAAALAAALTASAAAAAPAEAEPGPGFLGITSHGLSGEEARRLGLPSRDGAVIDRVHAGSAAEAAGLKEDDLLVEFDGKKVLDEADLTEMIRSRHPGDKVAIVVLRGKDRITAQATLGKAEEVEDSEQPSWARVVEHLFGEEESRPKLGVNTMELNSQLAAYFAVADGEGVLITRVATNSPAQRGGILAGDVITKVEGRKVSGPADIGTALRDKEGKTVAIEVVRKGSRKDLKVALD